MILMIWVFDGLRTINKDKDIGTLMVGCMKLAGMGNYARYIGGAWGSHWDDKSPLFA